MTAATSMRTRRWLGALMALVVAVTASDNSGHTTSPAASAVPTAESAHSHSRLTDEASKVRQSKFWKWDDGREPVRSKIDTDDLNFPPGFLWGTATAAHQVEGGCTNNNWARWEEGTDESGAPRRRAGAACEHWERFREDIALMQHLGVNSYRFSIEWSKIEPQPGVYDAAAIAHYHELIDALAEAGIVPMITLFHFSLPAWFEERGGFEQATNVPAFVAFAQRAFAEYGPKCQLWCTVNEPEVYVEGGWSSGKFPPAKKDAKLAAVVLRNVLDAHTEAYLALKAMPGGSSAQIGIVKDVFQFEPLSSLNPLDAAAAAIVDGMMNESILRYLRTGQFWFWIPGSARLSAENPKAAGAFDFIGLNYYSHFHVQCTPTGAQGPFELRHLPREEALMTDMNHPVYPEGLYHALRRVAKLGKPVFVTENGIADGNDDRRQLYLRRYLYALSAAIADGVDVRGYYHWTLLDNYEWNHGYEMKFGLFECDRATQRRTMRPSAEYFRSVISRFCPPAEMEGASAYAPGGSGAGLLGAASGAGSERAAPSPADSVDAAVAQPAGGRADDGAANDQPGAAAGSTPAGGGASASPDSAGGDS